MTTFIAIIFLLVIASCPIVLMFLKFKRDMGRLNKNFTIVEGDRVEPDANPTGEEKIVEYLTADEMNRLARDGVVTIQRNGGRMTIASEKKWRKT